MSTHQSKEYIKHPPHCSYLTAVPLDLTNKCMNVCTIVNMPQKFTSNTLRLWSQSASTRGILYPAPALLTSMPKPLAPIFASTASTATTDSGMLMSRARIFPRRAARPDGLLFGTSRAVANAEVGAEPMTPSTRARDKNGLGRHIRWCFLLCFSTEFFKIHAGEHNERLFLTESPAYKETGTKK